MNCGENTVKYLLFLFNLIFSLCGLALLVCGVIAHMQLKKLSDDIQGGVSSPAIALIVLGCIIFVIAFFGCCGAIRDNHCMVVTFAILLLTILVIQIALAIYAFVMTNGMNIDSIKEKYKKAQDEYWVKSTDQAIVDGVQTLLHCCGADGPQDYINGPHANGTYPWSCCALKNDDSIKTCNANEVYPDGCKEHLVDALKTLGKIIGGVVLGIAAVELVGIVFALCLANSIRNDQRRNFRV